jgi:hypothetical protein
VSDREMTEDEATQAALESRLFDLQIQIDRSARQATTAKDPSEQDRCWRAAEDFQAEARKLREELAHIAEQKRPPSRWSTFWRIRRAPSR